MATPLENVLEIFGLLIGLIPFTIGLFILVFIGAQLRSYLEKRFKLSWTISALSSALILLFVLLLAIYLIPSGFQFISANDSIPTEITQVDVQTESDALNPVSDTPNLIAGFLGILFHVLIVSVILAFLSFPFVLVGSILESTLTTNKKKSSPLIARLIAVYVMALVAVVVLLAFPWIAAGIAYFFFFS